MGLVFSAMGKQGQRRSNQDAAGEAVEFKAYQRRPGSLDEKKAASSYRTASSEAQGGGRAGKPLNQRTAAAYDDANAAAKRVKVTLDTRLTSWTATSIQQTQLKGLVVSGMRALDLERRAHFLSDLVDGLRTRFGQDDIDEATIATMVAAIVETTHKSELPATVAGLLDAFGAPGIVLGEFSRIMQAIRARANEVSHGVLVQVVKEMAGCLNGSSMDHELLHELTGAAFWMGSEAVRDPAAMIKTIGKSFENMDERAFKRLLTGILRHWQDAIDFSLDLNALWSAIDALVRRVGQVDGVDRDSKIQNVSGLTLKQLSLLVEGVLHCRWRKVEDLALSLARVHKLALDCGHRIDSAQRLDRILAPSLDRIMKDIDDARYAISGPLVQVADRKPFTRAASHKEAAHALAALWRMGDRNATWCERIFNRMLEEIPEMSPDRLEELLYSLAVNVLDDPVATGIFSGCSLLEFVVHFAPKDSSALQLHAMMRGYAFAYARRWRSPLAELGKLEAACGQAREALRGKQAEADNGAGVGQAARQELIDIKARMADLETRIEATHARVAEEQQKFIREVLQQLASSAPRKGEQHPLYRYAAAVHALAQVLMEPELFGGPLADVYLDARLSRFSEDQLIVVMMAILQGCGLRPQLPRARPASPLLEASLSVTSSDGAPPDVKSEDTSGSATPTETKRTLSFSDKTPNPQQTKRKQDTDTAHATSDLVRMLKDGLTERMGSPDSKAVVARPLFVGLEKAAELATIQELPREGETDGLQLAALAYVPPAREGVEQMHEVVRGLVAMENHQRSSLHLLRMVIDDRQIDLDPDAFRVVHQRLLDSLDATLASEQPGEAVEALATFYGQVVRSAGLGFAMVDKPGAPISSVQAARHQERIGKAQALLSAAKRDIGHERLSNGGVRKHVEGAIAYFSQTVEAASAALGLPSAKEGDKRRESAELEEQVETKLTSSRTLSNAPLLTIQEDENSLDRSRFTTDSTRKRAPDSKENGGEDIDHRQVNFHPVRSSSSSTSSSSQTTSTASLEGSARVTSTSAPLLSVPPTQPGNPGPANAADAVDRWLSSVGSADRTALDEHERALVALVGPDPKDDVVQRVCGRIRVRAASDKQASAKTVELAVRAMGGAKMPPMRLALITESLLGELQPETATAKAKAMGLANAVMDAQRGISLPHLIAVVSSLKSPSRNIPPQSRVNFATEFLRHFVLGSLQEAALLQLLPPGDSYKKRFELALNIAPPQTPARAARVSTSSRTDKPEQPTTEKKAS